MSWQYAPTQIVREISIRISLFLRMVVLGQSNVQIKPQGEQNEGVTLRNHFRSRQFKREGSTDRLVHRSPRKQIPHSTHQQLPLHYTTYILRSLRRLANTLSGPSKKTGEMSSPPMKRKRKLTQQLPPGQQKWHQRIAKDGNVMNDGGKQRKKCFSDQCKLCSHKTW